MYDADLLKDRFGCVCWLEGMVVFLRLCILATMALPGS